MFTRLVLVFEESGAAGERTWHEKGKLSNEEFCNFYCWLNVISVIESRMRKWTVHAHGKNCIRHFSDTKMNLRRICCKNINVLIDLALDNPVMSFSEQYIEPFYFQKAENSFSSLICWHQLTEQFHISLGWTGGLAYWSIPSSHFIYNIIFS
jgi:hypothetical protein